MRFSKLLPVICLLLVVDAQAKDDSFRLPNVDDIFTVAFQINGEHKNTVHEFDESSLKEILPQLKPLPNSSQKAPPDILDAGPYRSQDGIIVTKNKKVYAFAIFFRETEYNRGVRDGFVYFYAGDGAGLHWFILQPGEIKKKSAQPTNAPYSSPAAGSKR